MTFKIKQKKLIKIKTSKKLLVYFLKRKIINLWIFKLKKSFFISYKIVHLWKIINYSLRFLKENVIQTNIKYIFQLSLSLNFTKFKKTATKPKQNIRVDISKLKFGLNKKVS